MLLTLASWLAMATSFWMLTLAFHLGGAPLAGVLIVVATNLGQVVPLAPDAVTAYGVPRPLGLSYAVALHVFNFLPYLLIGPIALRYTPVAGPFVRRTGALRRESI